MAISPDARLHRYTPKPCPPSYHQGTDRLAGHQPRSKTGLAGLTKECTSPVRAYVGVTDDQWYGFLADRPGLPEVNFWQPSGGRQFHVLAPGEPFFFKAHYPQNRSWAAASSAAPRSCGSRRLGNYSAR